MTTPPDATLPPPHGRPVRKDEIELHDRGLYIESWLPERRSRRQAAAVRPRRARRLVGLGAVPRLLRRARLGRPRAQPPEPPLEPDRRPGRALVRVVRRGRRRGDGSARAGRRRRRAWHGRPARAQGRRAPPRQRPRARSRRSCPATSATPTEPHRDPRGARAVRAVAARLGDASREAAARPPRPDPRRRAPHPAPDGPEAARVRAAPGGRCCAASRSIRPRLADVPKLVIGGGLDRVVPLEATERLATWLDAEFEPFGAHSHYGLILGEEGYAQVADAIRGVPRGSPAVGRDAGRMPPARRIPPGAPVPHSSRGPGHRPLKAEIIGSNPICGTTSPSGNRPASGRVLQCVMPTLRIRDRSHAHRRVRRRVGRGRHRRTWLHDRTIEATRLGSSGPFLGPWSSSLPSTWPPRWLDVAAAAGRRAVARPPSRSTPAPSPSSTAGSTRSRGRSRPARR